MKVVHITAVIILSFATAACLDEMGGSPTPLVNTQLAQLQTQIEELEHHLAVCYAGHELEKGEEEKFLPKPLSSRVAPGGSRR
jgi:hypothetical protein